MGTICGCSMEYYQCQWLLRKRWLLQKEMTIRHNYQLSKYFRKENAYCWAPSVAVASPPTFSSMTFGKVTGWNWTRTCVCSLTVEWMARAVPGAVPGAQGQANPLAQGLTEKHPSFQIEKSDERPCPGRSGRCRRSPMGLRGINERKKHRPSGP